MPTITIVALGGTWHATHTDPRVRQLFGTFTLPTPFTTEVAVDHVLRTLRELNPGAQVRVEGSDRPTPDGHQAPTANQEEKPCSTRLTDGM